MNKSVKIVLSTLLAILLLSVPCISAFAEDGDATVEASFIDLENADLAPYITLGNYTNLPIELNVNVTLEDLDREARENNIYVSVTDRNTAAGDTVKVTYSGKAQLSNGRWLTVEGATASGAGMELKKPENVKTVADYLADKGLLEGRKPGESFEFTETFPEDFPVSTVAGRSITFTASVSAIIEYKYTDSYVKSKLGFNTVEEYRIYRIKQNLLYFADELKYELYLTITKNSTINSYPEEHLQRYIELNRNDYRAIYEQSYKDYYDTFEEFCEANGITDEEIRKMSVYSVEADLVMAALYKTGHFGKISEDEYSARMKEIAASEKLTVLELEQKYLGKYDVKNRIITEYVLDLLAVEAYGIYDLTTDFEEYEYLLNEPENTEGETTQKNPSQTSPSGTGNSGNGGGVDLIKIVGFCAIGVLVACAVAFCVITAVMASKQKKQTVKPVEEEEDEEEESEEESGNESEEDEE